MMRKKTILSIGVVVTAVSILLGWLLLSSKSEPEFVVPVTDQSMSEEVHIENNLGMSNDDDLLNDETRIIWVDPGGGKQGEMLSEKVIRNDRVVNKND